MYTSTTSAWYFITNTLLLCCKVADVHISIILYTQVPLYLMNSYYAKETLQASAHKFSQLVQIQRTVFEYLYLLRARTWSYFTSLSLLQLLQQLLCGMLSHSCFFHFYYVLILCLYEGTNILSFVLEVSWLCQFVALSSS